MKCNLSGSLLIASMLVVTWATTSEACHRHRRRACAPVTYYSAGYNCGGYGSPGTAGYYGGGGSYGMAGGGYSDGGYAGGTAGYPGGYGYVQPEYGYVQPGNEYVQPGYGYGQAGYGYGRPYNPGGIGGPASGLGVRPGLGVGGLGRGR